MMTGDVSPVAMFILKNSIPQYFWCSNVFFFLDVLNAEIFVILKKIVLLNVSNSA